MRHDQLDNPAAGPDQMWSTTIAPSRGQLETLARLACQLLGQPLEHRLHATVAITRLQLAVQAGDIPQPMRDLDDMVPF